MTARRTGRAAVGAAMLAAVAVSGQSEAQGYGEWYVHTVVDEMDGTQDKRVSVLVRRDEEVLGLTILCGLRGLTVAFGFVDLHEHDPGMSVGSVRSYRVRWDGDPPQRLSFEMHQRRFINLVGDDAEFVANLKARDLFRIELISEYGAAIFRFPLAGATRAIDQLPCVR